MRVALSAALVLSFAVAGCETLQLNARLQERPGDTITEGGDAQRSHRRIEALAVPLVEAWTYNGEAGFGPAALLTAGGYLIAVNRTGEVHVLDADTGRRVGKAELGEAGDGAPVLLSGHRLVLPMAAGKFGLQAYDLERGARVWGRRDPLYAAGLLTTEAGVIAAALDGSIRLIDPADGTERWVLRPDSLASFYATPVRVGRDRVLVTDDRGRVTMLDPTSGSVIAGTILEAPTVMTPTVAGDLVVLPTTRGLVVGLDARTGAARWRYTLDDATLRFASAAVTDELAVLGGSDGVLRALDLASGAVRWSSRFDGVIAAAPLIAGHQVVVGTMDQRLAVLDVRTGERLWETEVSGRIKTAPVVAGGRVIVAVEPKEILAFEPATLSVQNGR